MTEPVTTLVEALERLPRRPGRGFTFISADKSRNTYSYEELHQEAMRRGKFFLSKGLKKGDRLALVIPEGNEFVLSFLGTVVAGVVPVPIFPRETFKALDGYVEIVGHITEAAGSEYLLTMEQTKPFVEKVLEREVGLKDIWTVESCFDGSTPEGFDLPSVTPEDLCFLQFTSGSTSRPKGVMVRHSNLVANAQAFLGPHGLDRVDADVGVSWLPLYHDMGLIGFILGTLICDIPVVILPTASFARGPRQWLELLHEFRGTITYAPNFAYDLAAKRVRDRDLERLDLSCVRVAGCGAEPIRATTLTRFAERLKPAGFDGDKAYLPSYGMAEATLAISFHKLGNPVGVDRVDPEAMKEGKATPSNGEDALELVSCGKGFPGHEIAILKDNVPLGEREVGEIVVKGPSITGGYYKNEAATAEAYRDGWLHTGDLGYFADGNLYICGRVKDLIIVNGANHYPQDLEWAVGDLPKVRRGNVVAFSVDGDPTERLVVVAEGNSGDAADLRGEIQRTLAMGFGLQVDHVSVVPVGTIPKTSSGKAQRRKTRALFLQGDLPEHP